MRRRPERELGSSLADEESATREELHELRVQRLRSKLDGAGPPDAAARHRAHSVAIALAGVSLVVYALAYDGAPAPPPPAPPLSSLIYDGAPAPPPPRAAPRAPGEEAVEEGC